MPPPKDILALNRFETGADLPADLAERVRRRHASFGAASFLFYQQPIEMVRAEGAAMYDATGRRYLDVYNNVPSVGHCHPRVVAAIADQAARLNTNTRYLHRTVETYAERLLATFPAELANLALACTGSEANDLALRIARIATGAQGFIVTEAAYHGNTALVTELSPASLRRRRPAPFVRTIPAPTGADAAGIEASFAAAVTAAIADLVDSGLGFAALIVDTIFSSDGVYADPPGFLRAAVAATHRAGGLFIADEVQPGFGRTGAGLWGFQRHGLTPDIVTLGKPMGNGYPMSGVVTRPELLRQFCEETGYFNTFGGNPVAAAAGLAVLDVIADENLIEHAHTVGTDLKHRLEQLAAHLPAIAAVRGAGLFLGVDLLEPDRHTPGAALTTRLINQLKDHGILIGAAGKHAATLKIRPPLCFNRADADQLVDTLAQLLSAPSP